MALFWLKAVPWAAIISNAPVILDAARKLVTHVRGKRETVETPGPRTALSGDADTDIATLAGRVDRIEQAQQQAAELLRSMAESNAQLAQAVDALHRRAVRNMRLVWIALAGLALLAAWTLTR